MPFCLRSTHAVLLFCGFALLSTGLSNDSRVSHTDSVPVLNRVTFDGSVFAETAHAEHWVVFFCVDWYPPCQTLRESYLDLASEYERKLNANLLLQLSVRFAEVDCAVDKVLCNEQMVEMYPAIVHYRHGKRVGSWENSNGKADKEEAKMHKFLAKEMDFQSVQVEAQEEVVSGNASADIWHLPMAQQHPVTTAIRLAPLAAALMGMAVWIFTTGAEAVHSIKGLCSRSAVQLHKARRSVFSEELKKPAVQQWRPPETREGLHKRLPESWARERQSIEL